MRCRGLWLFDNSSGHGKTAAGARNAGACNKGPDWTGKVPPMRDGWYTKVASDEHGKQYLARVVQRMQFQRGDVLPCDLVVPAGLDPDATATGEARRPQILPEQLFDRQVVTTLSDLSIPGTIIPEPREPDEDGNEQVAIEWDDPHMEDTLATVAEVLEMLVGPPPDPEQHQEALPTDAESDAAFEKFFAGRAGTLKKHNPGKERSALRVLAQAEWPKLTAERRLHFVRKVRAAAQPGTAAASERTIAAGQPVPPALWGRHKGSEVLLAERGLLPSQALRGACSSEKGESPAARSLPARVITLPACAPRPHSCLQPRLQHPCRHLHSHSHPPPSSEHGKLSCMPCNAPTPGLLWGRGLLFNRRMAEHTANSCCCRHMLAAQPDFREEASALQHEIEQPITISHRQGSMQASPCTDRIPAPALSLLCHCAAPSSLVAGGWAGTCRSLSASGAWWQVPRHTCLFLPKFHCEMNAIERYWGATKKYLRRHCSYSLPGLRAGLQVALSQSLDDLPEGSRSSEDLPVSPLLKIRRWFRISWQYAAEYRKGSECAEVVRSLAAQRSKRHRDTSVRRARQAEAAMEDAAMEGMRRCKRGNSPIIDVVVSAFLRALVHTTM